MNNIKYNMIITKKDQRQSLTKLKDQFNVFKHFNSENWIIYAEK
jgi:hypothetical protein